MSRKARIIIMPMTITAIMAPELWMRICSLDLVTVVVLAAVVVFIAGESVDACIFLATQCPVLNQASGSPQSSTQGSIVHTGRRVQ